jgi:hypothetical protein
MKERGLRMNGQVQVEHEAFMRALDGGRLRMMQIIHFMLLAGVLMFGMMIVFFWIQRTDTSGSGMQKDDALLKMLSLVNIVMLAAAFVAGHLIYSWLSGPRGVVLVGKNPTYRDFSTEAKCAIALFTGAIFRLAIFEGVALFGLIVCLLGILGGEMAEKPIYWINLVSPAVFVLLVLATFPTRGRMEALFLRRFTDRTPFNTL